MISITSLKIQMALAMFFIMLSCGKRSTFFSVDPVSKTTVSLGDDLNSASKIPVSSQTVEEGDLDDSLDVAAVCEGASSFETITKTVKFPARSGCAFGENGNLEKKNTSFQAQSTENQKFSIPSDRVLCDLSFNSIQDQVRYDDFFVLSLDDYILISTHSAFIREDSADKKMNGLYKWDFNKVKGEAWMNSRERSYCLGKNSTCIVPKTDTDGRIKVAVAGEELTSLGKVLLSRKELNIGLSTIGDNDDGDCSHSNLEFVFDFKFASRN